MQKIALLIFVVAFSSVSAFPQVINSILQRMEQHQKALKSLQANITITKFSVQSGGTYTKEGVIKIFPQATDYLLRIDSIKPAPESFLAIKNQYLLHLPNLKTAHTGTMSDSQNNTFLLFSILSKEKLKPDYNIKYLGEGKVNGTIPAWHLELTPKTPSNYKTVELWVDANGMPIQSKVIENNGDRTNILLASLQKNVTMKATDFKIDLPKETKIIKQ